MDRRTRSSSSKSKTNVTSPYFKSEKKATVKTEKKTIVKSEKKITIKSEIQRQLLAISQNADKGVEDNLDSDLKVMFIGINPGLMSAAKGHHYAGPTNHFWPCLSESGLVDCKVTYMDDTTLPERYRLGFTNLTARTTRRQSDLSVAEQSEGIPVLRHKLETLRPRVACFVGKGIYEIYSEEKCKVMGLQSQSHSVPWEDGSGETVMFVMPSTSGIVSAYQRPDRIKYMDQ
jgi:mismatch-specific thymine-DNA glycosylase